MKIYSLILFFLVSCKPPLKWNPLSYAGLIIRATVNSNITKTDSSSTTQSNSSIATPAFNFPPGHYSTSITISITSSTADAILYYTTDGSNPTSSSSKYVTGFPIWTIAGRPIKAIAVKSGSTDSAILTGTFSYPPLKTGETSVQSAGDDGSTQLGITRSYTGPIQNSTYTSDYTTLDNSTGLIWKTCSQGLTGSTCGTGTMQLLINDGSANDATNNPTYGCSVLNSMNGGLGFSGQKGWRLPTIQELATLVNISASNPAISSTFFPSTGFANYWTQTMDQTNTANSRVIHFGSGDISSISKSSSAYVRCVSSSLINEFHSYKDNGDGTVKDNGTGLIWQKCGPGLTNDSTCSGTSGSNAWTNMLNYCNGLTLGGKTWRLSNRNEILSLIDFTKSTSPIIDLTYFPSTQGSGFYWTSNSYAPNIANGLFVQFNTGNFSNIVKSTAGYARCVTGP